MVETADTNRGSQSDGGGRRRNGSPHDELIEDRISRYRVRLSSESDVLTGEFWVDPGGGAKAEHYHPTVEERFHVLQGHITYRADGRKHTAGPGTDFTIPAGVAHSFVNTGDRTAHVLVEMEPALEMEHLFRDAAALGRDGKWMTIGRRGVPTRPRSL